MKTTAKLSITVLFILLNISAYSQDWSLTGNAGTDPATNFLGTTDSKNLKFRTNGVVRMNLTSSGKIAVGNFTPVFKFDVKGGSINTDSLYRISGAQVLTRSAINNIQIGDSAAKIGIGTSVPASKLHVEGAVASSENIFYAKTNFAGTSDVRAIDAYSKPAAGYGFGVYAQGGYQGVFGYGLGGAGYTSDVYGVNAQATGTSGIAYGLRGLAIGTGTNYGIYAAASGGTTNWAGYFSGNTYVSTNAIVNGNIGIGTSTPVNRLDVVGVMTSTGNAGIGTNAPISRLSLYNTGIGTATADIKNLTLGANISWIHFGTAGDWYIRSAANTGKVILQDQNANSLVSIGTIGGASKLNVVQTGITVGTAEFSNISKGSNFSHIHFGTTGDWFIRSAANAGNVVLQDQAAGTVCIGTSVPATGYKLSVKGKIMSEEFKVQLQANWPDYVFNDDYRLTSIYDLEKSIKQNKHLPGIPSATEVKNDGGFLVGEMQTKLLEKIEELTLYIIAQQKQIDALTLRIEKSSK